MPETLQERRRTCGYRSREEVVREKESECLRQYRTEEGTRNGNNMNKEHVERQAWGDARTNTARRKEQRL